MKLVIKVAAFAAVAVAAYAYFDSQSGVETAQQSGSKAITGDAQQAADVTPAAVVAPTPATPRDVIETADGTLKRVSQATTARSSKPFPDERKRLLGEPLDPETHIPEGAPELRVVGEPMDPDRVYPDSGAKVRKVIGQRIVNPDDYLGEGAEQPRYIGKRILSRDVQ
jgi:hypothetical protein